jgi:two-component system chemotaxis response regulator CheY
MSYDFTNVNVLVVESSPEMYQLIKDVLSLLKIPEKNIHPAYDAEVAFVDFCRVQHDIVIMDWLRNPDHGILLTQQIRRNESSPNEYVPIIMTAGSGHYNRVRRSIDAGVSEYLVKPFSAAALARRIVRVIEDPRIFVSSDAYCGPERRVRELSYQGEEKRVETVDAIELEE